MSVAKRLVDKILLHKIHVNDKCASRCYLPPHGPSATSEWRRASRPEIPEYVNGLLHYELAIMADKHRILDFLMQHVIPDSPLFACLGADPSELLDLYEPIVERTLKDHCSLLGFKGDELIAVSLNSIKSVSSNSNNASLAADIVASKDYTEEINGSTFNSQAAKKVACFAKLLRNKFDTLLPSGAHKVCFIEIGGIKAGYKGQGISQEMVKHSMRLARDQFHCDLIICMVDSVAAQKLFEQKLGYELLRELKLAHYLEGTNPVFFCDIDDSVSGKLLCKRL